MLLIFQIAAGIVLAYLVIRFRHSVWAATLGVLAVAAIVAAVVGVGAGVSVVADEIPINWTKVVMVAWMLPIFALAGVGAYGLLTLFRITFRTERPRTDGDGCFPVLLFFGILNMIIVAATAAAIEAIFPNNPVGQAAEAIDDWSRAAGHKDLGSVLFGTALMAAWPWLIFAALIGIANLRRRGPERLLSDDEQGI